MSWYPATVTVAAASEPISLDEARTHDRWDGSTDNDTALSLYIASARAYVEKYCGTALVTRTVTVKCDSFDDFAVFPLAPLSSVSSVSYVDTAGATQTLSTDVYEVRIDGLEASIVLKYGQSWPGIQSGSRITVTAVLGYSAIPPDIKHALLALVAQGDNEREAAFAGVHDLLANHRIYVGT